MDGVKKIEAMKKQPSDLLWLSEVRPTVYPLTENEPIWVRHGVIARGPLISHPEWHPHCEIGVCLSGACIQFVGKERAQRWPGDIFLAFPGLPHWAMGTQYPNRFVTIYFLPNLLIELGPSEDGAALLHRMTRSAWLKDHLLSPPPRLRKRTMTLFQTIAREFDRDEAGREMRLRALLIELLVGVLRWEKEAGRVVDNPGNPSSWQRVIRVLAHLRQHHDQPIYARSLAAAVGMSESRLKALFRETIGIPWAQYLVRYRIHRAMAHLLEPGLSVSEAASKAGFGSISHFNATFRQFMGMSPKDYIRRTQDRTR